MVVRRGGKRREIECLINQGTKSIKGNGEGIKRGVIEGSKGNGVGIKGGVWRVAMRTLNKNCQEIVVRASFEGSLKGRRKVGKN